MSGASAGWVFLSLMALPAGRVDGAPVARAVAGVRDAPTAAPARGQRNQNQPASDTVTVTEVDFHGWKAIALRNPRAEVLIVPEVGRVMRFGLIDDSGHARAIGPFWNHPKLATDGSGAGGRAAATNEGPEPDAEGWVNTGGDKAWPAPQSDWPRVTGKGWPPPKAFDAAPQIASVHGSTIELVSPVDDDYGVRVRRRVTLDRRAPVMAIETSYEKVRGAPVTIGVWTITQLVPPERLFIRLPAQPSAGFPAGYRALLPDSPRDLAVDDIAPTNPTSPGVRQLSLARDRSKKTMIASDGRALLWVGRGRSPDSVPDLLIEDITMSIDRRAGAVARSQIYTSPGDDDGAGTYVELELLAPPARLAVGGKTTLRSRYTLIPRSETDPRDEAKAVWHRLEAK